MPPEKFFLLFCLRSRLFVLVPSNNVVHTCICLLHKSLAKVLTVLHKHVHVKFGGYKFMFFHFDERLQEPLKNGAGKRQCVHHPTQQQKLHQHKFIHALCPGLKVLTNKRSST